MSAHLAHVLFVTSILKSFSTGLLATILSEFGLLFWMLTISLWSWKKHNVFSCLRNTANLMREYGKTSQHEERSAGAVPPKPGTETGSKYTPNCQRRNKLSLEEKKKKRQGLIGLNCSKRVGKS